MRHVIVCAQRRLALLLVCCFTSITSVAQTDDFGNTIATATTIQSTSRTAGAIETTGDEDFFRIDVAQESILTLYTEGTLDTNGYLLDSSGAQIAADDSSGTSLNFRIDQRVPAGTYYLRLRAWSGTGSYTLVASLAAVTDDHGDTTDTATLITLGSSISGVLNWTGDVDFFRFQVTQVGVVTLISSGATEKIGTLYDSAGNTIVTDYYGSGSYGNFAIQRKLAPGTYYLSTKKQSYSSLNAGNYTVTTSFAVDDHGDNTGTATSVGVNSQTAGVFEWNSDDDYFRIDIAQAGILTVSTTGNTDTFGHLLDAAGNQLAGNDYSGTDRNFRIIWSVAPGTYYVRVRPYMSSVSASAAAYTFVSAFAAGNPDVDGSTIATASTMALNTVKNAVIDWDADVDYFSFTVPTTGVVGVTLTSTAGTAPGWRVLTATGTQVEGYFPTKLAAGTYYVAVNGQNPYYSYSSSGAYTLTVAYELDDHGDTIASATPAAANGRVDGKIQWSQDVDYFAIDIAVESIITVTNATSSSVQACLTDAQGVEIPAATSRPYNADYLIKMKLATGRYYVCARQSYQNGSYGLNIATELDDHGDSITAATVVDANSTTQGNIQFGGDRDIFRVTVAVPGRLTVESSGTTDTFGFLRDASGAGLIYDNNSGEGDNFRFEQEVVAGTYYIGVRHVDPAFGMGPYTLAVSFASIAGTVNPRAITTAGSNKSWNTYQGNPSRTGFVPESLVASNFKLKWSRQVATGLNQLSVAGGKAFLAQSGAYTASSSLYALDLATGDIAWSKDFGVIRGISGTGTGQGSVYLVTDESYSDSYLRAYSQQDGSLIFRSAGNSYLSGSAVAPLIVGDKVISGNDFSYAAVANDAVSGAKLWYQYSNGRIDRGIAADEKQIYGQGSNYDGPSVYANDLDTGASVFGLSSHAATGYGGYSYSATMIDARRNVIVQTDNQLVAFDVLDGRVLWNMSAQFSGQPAIDDNYVYALTAGVLSVRDIKTGEFVWAWEIPNERLEGQVIVTKSHAFVRSGSGTYAINLTDRSQAWRFNAVGEMSMAQGMLLIATETGTVFAIDLGVNVVSTGESLTQQGTLRFTLDRVSVLNDTTAAAFVTISNVSSGRVTLDNLTVGESGYTLSLDGGDNPCSAVGSALASGASCTVQVSFDRSIGANMSVSLSVATTVISSGTISVRLSGEGADLVAPVISVKDVVVEATGPQTAIVLNASAVDGGAGAVTATPDVQGPFAVGTTTVVWSASDAAGNLAHAQQQVVVRDTTPPTLTLPSDVTVNAKGVLSAVALGEATANDLVDGKVAVVSDFQGPFTSGRHTVTWTTVDGAGNKSTGKQIVTVIPAANFAIGQWVNEGATVNVEVILTGVPVSYPVRVPYTVSGTASAGDVTGIANGELVITSGTSGFISFQVLDDGVIGEPDKTVILTMTQPENAALGTVVSHTVTITETPLPPLVQLVPQQASVTSRLLAKDSGVVTVTANASTLPIGESQSVDWSQTDAALLTTRIGDLSTPTFSFDPAQVAAGIYALRAKAAGANTVTELTVRIVESLPKFVSGSDSDGDGISDEVEGWSDEDLDGIPAYLDSFAGANILPATSVVPVKQLVEVSPGLRLSLGQRALAAAQLTPQLLAGDASGANTVPVDTAASAPTSGFYDFNVAGMTRTGATVQVVIAQAAAIPPDGVYRLYSGSTGWSSFVENGSNYLASAPASNGICPPLGDASYQTGLQKGAACVQITVEDGGPNDADGIANGSIAQFGGVAVLNSSGKPGPEPIVDPVGGSGGDSGGGGGGSANVFIVSFLLSVFLLRLRVATGKQRGKDRRYA